MTRRKWIAWTGLSILAAVLLFLPPARGIGMARGDRLAGENTPYQPTWESVSTHPVPRWFEDAKFGIFIHWGLFSVPAWALPQDPRTFSLTKFLSDPAQFTDPAHHAYGIMPYAEWYFNTMQIPGSPTWERHRTIYPSPLGPIAAYLDNFVPAFNAAARQWRPDEWASLFQEVGACYVVLVTRHHDGFSLWPSAVPNPNRRADQQHAERDVVGELTDAVRARGIRMGLYYSGGIDWSFPSQFGFPIVPIKNIIDFLAPTPESLEYTLYANAQWHELIQRYRPSVLWNDIANPLLLSAPALFADYYNTLPDGVVNDRWGIFPGLPVPHADFTTPENEASPETINPKKWEATRAIGTSFAYNQNEGPELMLTSPELVHLLVDTVSKNGNLLLGVGPAADGSIPSVQLEPLRGLGQWLMVNGEAIFKTRPWVRFGCPADRCGVEVRYTSKGDTLYATLLSRPQGDVITLPDVRAVRGTRITLLGRPGNLEWQQVGDDLAITLPPGLPVSAAYVLKLDPGSTDSPGSSAPRCEGE